MHTGRNEPCPCGSGEKYKRCCLVRQTGARSGEILFREAEAALMEEMLPFADQVFGETAIDQAWLLFLEDMTDVTFDPEDPLNVLFVPWFLYNWFIEDNSDKVFPDWVPIGKTVGELYLEKKAGDLSALDREIIEASLRRPLSFFEVLAVTPGQSLSLKDLLLDQKIEVTDDSASQSLKEGDIVLASIMGPVQQKLRPLALGPFALPPEAKEEVADLKQEWLETLDLSRIDERVLHSHEAFTIGLYLDLLDELLEDSEEDELS
jgi:hypothetical protein